MKRPKGVVAIVIYYFGSTTVLAPLLLLAAPKDMDLFFRSALLLTSLGLIVLSIGLWKMKNWARVSTAVLTGAGLVAGVVAKIHYGFSYDFGTWIIAKDLIVLALNLSIVVYLLSSKVRRTFLSGGLSPDQT